MVRSCEELPKLESVFPCSSCPLGFLLKKLLNRPVVCFLPGLRPPAEFRSGSGCDVGAASIGSLDGYGCSWSPFLGSRVVRRLELICRHQLESRERSERVAPLSPLILLLSQCCSLAPSRSPLAPCVRSMSEWLCGDDCWTGYSSTTVHVSLRNTHCIVRCTLVLTLTASGGSRSRHWPPVISVLLFRGRSCQRVLPIRYGAILRAGI